ETIYDGLPGLANRRLSSPISPGASAEHRNLSRDPGLEFADLRSLRDKLRPQLGTGAGLQCLRQYRERLRTHLDVDRGVGLEVVVPVGVGENWPTTRKSSWASLRLSSTSCSCEFPSRS